MRKTFCEVNLRNLKSNVEKIISKHNDYSYYFGVVKADCYGHGDLKSIQSIIYHFTHICTVFSKPNP